MKNLCIVAIVSNPCVVTRKLTKGQGVTPGPFWHVIKFGSVRLLQETLYKVEVQLMKTVVIYQSKTGFTKKYAEWISEELSADIFNALKVTANMLKLIT